MTSVQTGASQAGSVWEQLKQEIKAAAPGWALMILDLLLQSRLYHLSRCWNSLGTRVTLRDLKSRTLRNGYDLHCRMVSLLL